MSNYYRVAAGLLLVLSVAPVLHAQSETIPLQWNHVPEATGYRVFVSPNPLTCPEGAVVGVAEARDISPGDYSVDGTTVSYNVDRLLPATSYWITVKALVNGAESPDCAALAGSSGEKFLVGWPTPRVTNVTISAPSLIGGSNPTSWRIDVTITGENFKGAGQQYYVGYTGLAVVSSRNVNSTRAELTLEYSTQTPAGDVEVWIVNDDGANCDFRPAARYAGCVAVLAATIPIVPTMLTPRVEGLTWRIDASP